MSYKHKSVLVREVLEYLSPKPGGLYVDATFGGGGHTRAILESEPTCKVIAFDWDPDAFEHNKAQIEQDFPGRVTWVWKNFAQLFLSLRKIGIHHVDGVLADFGTSQYQIMHKPGFSFEIDSLLDMRMSTGHFKTNAYHIVNFATEAELATIFWEYGEERYGGQVARAICLARKEGKIASTHALVKVIETVIWPSANKIHPATRIFQALRIAVNKELENIHAFLKQIPSVLNSDGRLVCISFHSLEDRLVKQMLRDNAYQFKVLTPKIVTAQSDELAVNPSSRSARLRAAQRVI